MVNVTAAARALKLTIPLVAVNAARGTRALKVMVVGPVEGAAEGL